MKIVIVEDNQTLQKSIDKVLKDENHSTQAFFDGELARKWLMINHGSVDLCIIDYLLPGLDGISLIKLLREKQINVPVLMLTALSSIEDKVLGLSSGADYYLTKPFEFDELLACIKALHRRPSNFQSEVVEIYPGTICNLSNHTLLKEGESIHLTPTEFNILEYLIRHSGTAVTQEQLYEHSLDFAKENWSNTIEVHIKNLRRKLQSELYENPIKTIRGVGYALEIR